jgi:hypothetical protein
MSANPDLDIVLEKLDNLSVTELLLVQEKLKSRVLAQARLEAATTEFYNSLEPTYKDIPGTYQSTKAEIEEELAGIFTAFTPEELIVVDRPSQAKVGDEPNPV